MAIACRTCGNQNPDGVTACQYCGANLQPSGGQGAAAGTPGRQGYSLPPGGQGGYGQQPYGASYGTPPAPAQAYATQRAPEVKDPSSGLLFELLPGLFGFLGVGWLWAGETAIGIALLIGFWLFIAIEIVLMFVVIGFCLIPLNFILPIVSAIILQNRLKERQALAAGVRQF